MKFHQLIKHTKISYSIASLVFYKFSCMTYRNGLNRGTSGKGTPGTLKCTIRVSQIPSVGNFNILMYRVWYLKIYLCLVDNRSSFSRVSLKYEFLPLAKSNKNFGKQKFDVIKQLKMSKFICDVKQLKINKFIKSI